MLFHLQTSERDGWSVVAVGGDLDLTTAPQFRSEIVALVARGATRVVLDLGGVEVIDSVGLGVVVGALRRLRIRGGELRCGGCSDAVTRVLEVTDLDRALPVFASVEDAVAEPVAPRPGPATPSRAV